MDEGVKASWSPLSLAYVGDAVFELHVRRIIAGDGRRRPKELAKEAVRYVSAAAQSAMAEKLLPYFTEEEKDIYMRGRNANPGTVSRSASVAEYRRATGLEAVAGYLYLTGREDRFLTLLEKGMEEVSRNG